MISTVLLAALVSAASPQAERPNIIFILADDLGYGDLGCYGQKQIRTPNLDKLAAEGRRFTQHYAGSTVCAPSRCVLMTGLHTGHCFIRGNGRDNLRPEDLTVARLLKNAGYATGLMGKWGLGHEGSSGVPTRQGFDAFFGYLDQVHAHNYYPTFLLRNEVRISLKNVVPKEGAAGQGVATERVEYSHDLITREALSFIERHKDGPFFLYLAWTLPHANNEAGDKGMEVPELGAYAAERWPEVEKGFAAMVSRLDADVGRLVARLRELGIDEKTVIFFSSDNGPHREGGHDADFFDSNGPLRGTKRDLTDGGIRVPLIVRWPGRVPAGTTCDHVGGFQDFLPTAAELAGAAAPEGLDGISFVPAMLGQPGQKQHDALYWEFHERGGARAVRVGSLKAIQQPLSTPVRLYDLESDIGEARDLAGARPDDVRRLTRVLDEARTASERWKLSK
jgi:arylsulfatase A-like enzyme